MMISKESARADPRKPRKCRTVSSGSIVRYCGPALSKNTWSSALRGRLWGRTGGCTAAVIAFLAVAILLLVHAHRYAGFLSDDALISLRYSRRLVEGHGLSWTGYERVEGYTDLGWILLAAAGGRLGFDYIDVALALDRGGVLVALAMAGWSARKGRWSAPRLVLGGGLLAATVPLAVWANGALEHGLIAGVLTIAIYRLQRAVVTDGAIGAAATGVPLALLALLRADGVVLITLALGAAALLAIARCDRKLAAWLASTAALPAAAVFGQSLFRRIYYQQWWPQTALVKISLNVDRLRLGLDHLGRGYLAAVVLWVVAIAATGRLAQRRQLSHLLIPWSVTIGWSVYLGAVGGDIFPGWRQLLLALVPIGLIAAELGEEIPPRLVVLLVPATAGLAMLHLNLQLHDSENQRAAHELWEWDGLSVGPLLKRAFGDAQPLLAVDAAGALPYWSHLPSLDMLGLNDRYIARHPPPDFGHGAIGHELGDGTYVMERAPDLIAFMNAAGAHEPGFLSGRQLMAMPEFHERYTWMRVQGTGGNRAFGELWVRRDGRVGVKATADRIEIPGYLFTGQQSAAAARLDAHGTLSADLFASTPGVLPALTIPAGNWKIDVAATDGQIVLGLRCNGRSVLGVPGGRDFLIELDRPTALEIAAAPTLGQKHASLARVTFTRTDIASPRITCPDVGQRLSVALSTVSTPKPPGFAWDHPANVLIGPEGLVVRVDRASRVRALDLSVDENDTYAIEIFHRGASAWRTEVTPHPENGGLALHRIELPSPLEVEGGDKILVTPLNGDGFYSLGHLRLIN